MLFTLLAWIALAGGIVAVVSLLVTFAYPPYVESRFDDAIRQLRQNHDVEVIGSRCLWKERDRIDPAAIVYSKLLDRYPFITDEDWAFYEDAYWHGMWFNYCKQLRVDGKYVFAYWSVRENRWNIGDLRHSRDRTSAGRWTSWVTLDQLLQ